MSTNVHLSIFLFLEKLEKHPDLSYDWLEEASGFSCLNYDEDMCEMGGSDPWNLMPLAKAFTPMSWSEHWSAMAVKQARELGITKCRRALIVQWDDYQPKKLKRKRPGDPVLIGPVKF